MYLNIRSLEKNFDELQTYLVSLSNKPLFIAITETWLLNSSNTNKFNLTGYHPIIVKNRGIKRGGGLGIYLKSSLNFEEIAFDDNYDFEYLAVNVFSSGTTFTIHVIYNPPNNNKLFFEPI
ncbi:MAG: hypothetical protein AAGK97_12955, partial [Bacteroidota bacterium]